MTHDITQWTDEALDTLNYPEQPEWMSMLDLYPSNFQGYRGEYGGYFNGGRYSYEFELPTITYETAYCPHLAEIPSVPDGGIHTGLLMALCVGLVIVQNWANPELSDAVRSYDLL